MRIFSIKFAFLSTNFLIFIFLLFEIINLYKIASLSVTWSSVDPSFPMLPLSKEEFFFELLGEEGMVPDCRQS